MSTDIQIRSIGSLNFVLREARYVDRPSVKYEVGQTSSDARSVSKSSEAVLTDEEMTRFVEKANKLFRTTTIEFAIHEKTKTIIVKVLDRDSGEIIREIPPEKLLDILAGLWELAGLIVDERK